MNVTTVNEYIDNLEDGEKKYIADFYEFMKKEYPQIIPKISFSMPMWWAGPKMYNGYIAISAASKHYSVHFGDENYMNELKKVLPDCSFGKRCVNVKYGDDASITVVKQYVKQYLNGIL